MALKLSVKIGHVTNLSDARYAAGMGVDYIGFNLNPNSEHFVSPELFNEITNWISGVGIIGEIESEMLDKKEDYNSFLPEIATSERVPKLNEFVYRVYSNDIAIDQLEDMLAAIPKANFFIIEISPNQLDSMELQLIELCEKYPVYISTEFDKSMLIKVIDRIKPKGIEIKGSAEDQPGLKDYDHIADVLEWLEEN